MNKELTRRAFMLGTTLAGAYGLHFSKDALADPHRHSTKVSSEFQVDREEYDPYPNLRPTEVRAVGLPFEIQLNTSMYPQERPEDYSAQDKLDSFSIRQMSRFIALPRTSDGSLNIEEIADMISGSVVLPEKQPEAVLIEELRRGQAGYYTVKGYLPEAMYPEQQTELVQKVTNGISYEFVSTPQYIVIEESETGEPITSVAPKQGQNGELLLLVHHVFKPVALIPEYNIDTIEKALGLQVSKVMVIIGEVGALTGYDYALWNTYKDTINAQRSSWTQEGGYLRDLAVPLLGYYSPQAEQYIGPSPILAIPTQK